MWGRRGHVKQRPPERSRGGRAGHTRGPGLGGWPVSGQLRPTLCAHSDKGAGSLDAEAQTSTWVSRLHAGAGRPAAWLPGSQGPPVFPSPPRSLKPAVSPPAS